MFKCGGRSKMFINRISGLATSSCELNSCGTAIVLLLNKVRVLFIWIKMGNISGVNMKQL